MDSLFDDILSDAVPESATQPSGSDSSHLFDDIISDHLFDDIISDKEFTGALDGGGWGDVIGSIPTQMRESVNLGMAGIQRFTSELGRDEASIKRLEKLAEHEDPRIRKFAKNDLSRIQKWAPRQAELVSESIEESNRARLSLEEATPENLTFWQQAVVDASRSLGVALPGLAGSLLTGSPVPALVTMGGMELGTSYNEAREFGLDEKDAGRFAGINSAIEVLTEAVPLGTLLKRGTPFMARMLKLYGQELIGENLATVLQDANDFAMRNPNATLSDWHEGYVKARPEAAARTSAATVLATTVQGGAAGVVHSAMGKVREFDGELDAKEFTGELDRVETVAEMTPKGDVSSVFETDKVAPMTPKRWPGTEDLTQQTPLKPESEEFKRWFSGSKVVDENGEPLVMYHGSDVESINLSKGQFFTTSSPLLASQYTGYGDDFTEAEITGKVFPVFVNSGEYPLIIDANGATADSIPVSRKLIQEIDPEGELLHSGSAFIDDVSQKAFSSGKYDSLIVRNVVMNGKTGEKNIKSTIAVTFYAEQIKLIDRPESTGAPERAPPRTTTESEQQTPSNEGVTALGQVIPGIPPKVSASTVSAMPGSRYTGMLTEKALPEPAQPDKPDKPFRREDIIRPLMKYMGVPLYQGRVKGQNRLGFFRHVVEEVRIKYRNDLEVTAHEIAHLIDDRYPEFAKAYRRKEFAAEVRGVSYDAKKLNEGFAEFMRLFMTQETEAVQRVPKFYDWFTKTLENHKLGPILRETQAKMHAWYSQGALKRAESKLGSPKVPLRHQFDALIENWAEKAKQEIFDALHGVKVAELALKGKIQDATLSPYKSLRLVAGSRGIIRSVFKHGTINWDAEGNVVFTGQGLEQILNPVADRLDKVQLYFAGRRAQELKSQGRENLFRHDEIKAMLDLGKDNEIRQAFQDWLGFNKRMMDFYQKSGIVSAEARSAMEEMNKNYVPFHRVYEEITGEKKTRGGSPFMRLKGGTANVNDILDNITNSVSTLTHAALLNKAKQQAYDLIDGPGGARFAAKIPSEARAANIDSEQLKDKFLKAITGMGLAEYKQAQKIGQGNSSIDKMLTLLESRISNTSSFFTFL